VYEYGENKKKQSFYRVLPKEKNRCSRPDAAGSMERRSGKGPEQGDVGVCHPVKGAFEHCKTQASDKAQGRAERDVHIPAAAYNGKNRDEDNKAAQLLKQGGSNKYSEKGRPWPALPASAYGGGREKILEQGGDKKRENPGGQKCKEPGQCNLGLPEPKPEKNNKKRQGRA